MQKKEILIKTKEILNEIQQQVTAFEQQAYEISEIELDLFLANAKFLVDHAQIMKRLQDAALAMPSPIISSLEVPAMPVPDAPLEAIVAEQMPLAPEVLKPTLNDVLAEKTETTLANKYGQEPVTDLKSIISLNDKLVFVKDLFNGYSLAYQEAVDTLNRLDSLEEAKKYLFANYEEQNHWNEHEATVGRFYEVLARRYAK